MGFWHTGYIEFHEPVGLGERHVPRVPIYGCQYCEAEFTSAVDLRTHRFSKHPFTRPALFIRDLEIGQTPVRITAPLRPEDVMVARAKVARINGKDVPVDRLGQIFARTTWDVVNVSLSNDGASASFSVHLAIAELPHLLGVEKCFQNVARQGRLDMRALEDFIEASRQFKTAIGYGRAYDRVLRRSRDDQARTIHVTSRVRCCRFVQRSGSGGLAKLFVRHNSYVRLAARSCRYDEMVSGSSSHARLTLVLA